MATKTTGKLKLWLVAITDKVSNTWDVYLKENFESIDENISRLNDVRISIGNAPPAETVFWLDTSEEE